MSRPFLTEFNLKPHFIPPLRQFRHIPIQYSEKWEEKIFNILECQQTRKRLRQSFIQGQTPTVTPEMISRESAAIFLQQKILELVVTDVNYREEKKWFPEVSPKKKILILQRACRMLWVIKAASRKENTE